MVATRFRLGAAAVLVAVAAAASLLSSAAEAQKPEISVSASDTSVVGDGTNMVTITFSWMGTINTDGDPLWFQFLDPDDGFDLEPLSLTIESGMNGIFHVRPPSGGMGSISRTLTTQTLSPGDDDRTLRVSVIAFPTQPYAAHATEGVVEVTVTAPEPPPTITVVADIASFPGGRPAVFTLTRTGDAAAELEVNIRLDGNPWAFDPQPTVQALPTTATFPAGDSTVKVSIGTGGRTDDNEDIALIIQPGTGYTFGADPDDRATVTATVPPARMSLTYATGHGYPTGAGGVPIMSEGDSIDFVLTLRELFGPNPQPIAATEAFTAHLTLADATICGYDDNNNIASADDIQGGSPLDVQWNVGEMTKTITVTSIVDSILDEPDEWICAVFTGDRSTPAAAFATDASEAGGSKAVRLNNVATPAASPPTVTVEADTDFVPGTREAVFTLTRSGGTADLTVNIALTGEDNNAERELFPSSYTRQTTAIFRGSDSTVKVNVPTRSQPDDTFGMILTVEPGTGYTVGTPGNAMLDVGPPQRRMTLDFAPGHGYPIDGNGDATISEGDSIDFVLTLHGPTGPLPQPMAATEAFTTSYILTASPTTVCSHDDHNNLVDSADIQGGTTGQVTWPAGTTSMTFPIAAIHDSILDEEAEWVCINVTGAQSPAGAFSFNTSQVRAVRVNNVATPPAASGPEVSVEAESASVVGNRDDAVFIISRTGATTADLEVQFTMAGTDGAYRNFSSRPSMATILAGQSSVRVEVPTSSQQDGDTPAMTLTLDDDSAYTVDADNNMASVTVTEPPSNGPALPAVTVAAGAASVASGQPAVFNLTRTGDTAGALPVGIAITGNGASGSPPVLATFAAGSATVEVLVPTNTLAAGASSQSVILTIQASGDRSYTVSSGGTAAVTVEAPTLSFTVSAPTSAAVEPAPGATAVAANRLVFTVVASPAPAQPLTVPFTLGGTATEGEDYTAEPASKMLTFGPGAAATQEITVTASSDIIAESASGETVVATVRRQTATGRINEPSTQISVSTTDPTYEVEGGSTTVRFTFNDIPQSNPAPATDLVVAWRVDVGGSVGSVEGTVTYPAGSRRASNRSVQAVFRTELPSGRSIQVQVRGPSAATNLAVVPADASNVQIVASEWVVASTSTVVSEAPAALNHAIAGTGRAAAAGVVDSIWRRATARSAGNMESKATLGGRILDTQALSSGDAGRAVREVASLLGLKAAAPDDSLDAVNSVYSSGGGIDDYRAWAGIPDSGRIASTSNFALLFGDGADSGPIAIWGEYGVAAHESKPAAGASVDAESSSMTFGFDMPVSSDMLFGLAISRSSGETDYRETADQLRPNTIETSLTSFAPYVHWTMPSGLGVWGSFGMGEGKLTSKEAGGGSVKTDFSFQVLAGGARSEVGDYGLGRMALKGDVMMTTTEVNEASSSSASIAAVDAGSTHARVAIELVGNRERAGGSNISHQMELGARMDSGDADEGTGADVAFAFDYVIPEMGLEMRAQASMLLLHSQEGFEELGLGLGAIYDPGIVGRGASLSLEPTWNAPSMGVAESMWAAKNLDGHAASDVGAALTARLGYGAETRRVRALTTLYSEAEAGEEDQRLRLGVEMRGLDGPLERFSLDIYGEREENGSSLPDDAVMLEGRLGF